MSYQEDLKKLADPEFNLLSLNISAEIAGRVASKRLGGDEKDYETIQRTSYVVVNWGFEGDFSKIQSVIDVTIEEWKKDRNNFLSHPENYYDYIRSEVKNRS